MRLFSPSFSYARLRFLNFLLHYCFFRYSQQRPEHVVHSLLWCLSLNLWWYFHVFAFLQLYPHFSEVVTIF